MRGARHREIKAFLLKRLSKDRGNALCRHIEGFPLILRLVDALLSILSLKLLLVRHSARSQRASFPVTIHSIQYGAEEEKEKIV